MVRPLQSSKSNFSSESNVTRRLVHNGIIRQIKRKGDRERGCCVQLSLKNLIIAGPSSLGLRQSQRQASAHGLLLPHAQASDSKSSKLQCSGKKLKGSGGKNSSILGKSQAFCLQNATNRSINALKKPDLQAKQAEAVLPYVNPKKIQCFSARSLKSTRILRGTYYRT